MQNTERPRVYDERDDKEPIPPAGRERSSENLLNDTSDHTTERVYGTDAEEEDGAIVLTAEDIPPMKK